MGAARSRMRQSRNNCSSHSFYTDMFIIWEEGDLGGREAIFTHTHTHTTRETAATRNSPKVTRISNTNTNIKYLTRCCCCCCCRSSSLASPSLRLPFPFKILLPTTYIYIHPPYPTPYPLFFLLPTLRSSASSSMTLHRQAQNKTKKTFPPHIHLVFPQEFPWPKQNNPQDHRVSETPHPHKKTTPIYKRVLNQSSHGVRIKGISIVGEETKREAKTRGDHICQAHFCRTGS
jgi:hypothetical protein